MGCVIAGIPNATTAALILLEHHWAVPLRDAIVRAGGIRLSDGFISPLDLVDIGLLPADEDMDLHLPPSLTPNHEPSGAAPPRGRRRSGSLVRAPGDHLTAWTHRGRDDAATYRR